jgi:tRNA1Val (adenine37-N6)-methyltransferase
MKGLEKTTDMAMSASGFRFRQFTVNHDRCAMKVGTDGVLLGAWAEPGDAKYILDVGTGTGLVALMLAQRSEASIDAVEIEAEACEQARENILASPWPERITVYNDSFQHFAAGVTTRYNLVVSNPPYFRNSLHSPQKERTTARHDTRLGFTDLLAATDKILAADGRLAVIVPDPERNAITEEAWFYRLFPARITQIRPHEGKPFSRCLLEFSRQRLPSVNAEEIRIRPVAGGRYSEEYQALTCDFYL